MMTGSLYFSVTVAVGVLHIFGHPKEEMSCMVMGCTILESNHIGLEQSLRELFTSLTGSRSVVRLIKGLMGAAGGTYSTVHGQAFESDMAR
jgi:hypothetical protein